MKRRTRSLLNELGKWIPIAFAQELSQHTFAVSLGLLSLWFIGLVADILVSEEGLRVIIKRIDSFLMIVLLLMLVGQTMWQVFRRLYKSGGPHGLCLA